MKYRLTPVVIVGLILGCSSPKKRDVETKDHSSQIRYAEKFILQEGEVLVTEPWPGAVNPIRYPLTEVPKRIVVTSTTHLPYLELLGVEDHLVGFPSTQYISSPKIRARVEEGGITDLGPDGRMNLELLLSLQPDAVFAFDMGNESVTLDKVVESGIPVIYNADFLETSTLGRAEWIRFFGAFFDKDQLADSIFNAIAGRYDSLKVLAATVNSRPTILSGVMYGDVWFLPGGQNWSGKFFQDAGGQYLWGSDPTSGWLEVSFESVFSKAREADFWIGISTFNTLEELAGQDDRYTHFEAFQNKMVFNYNKRISPSGGYDFFESGYARPDVVLADLINILHPELMTGYETYYFQQVP